MTLTEDQVQILRDCRRFSSIRTYHGLLPDKIALMYDEELVKELITSSLIERGMVISGCGGELHGLRLTSKAEELLPVSAGPGLPPIRELRDLPESDFSNDDMALLRDVYHYSHIRSYGGMAPKSELEGTYGKKTLKRLYELGLLLSIRIKGRKSGRKGYVLSDVGHRVLMHSDTPQTAASA